MRVRYPEYRPDVTDNVGNIVAPRSSCTQRQGRDAFSEIHIRDTERDAGIVALWADRCLRSAPRDKMWERYLQPWGFIFNCTN
jgi:hypothetical protein